MTDGNNLEKVEFIPDVEGEKVQFYVLERTRLGGVDYLLVTDQPDGDAQALILKDITENDGDESVYRIVSDDKELDAVAAVFENMLDILNSWKTKKNKTGRQNINY